jgi:hypothetical protein
VGFRGRAHALAEYQYGLWRSIQTAQAAGWLVQVYHDGSVDGVLDRFRASFPPNVLQCIRVVLAPDLQRRRYLGCLLRLLAADDPTVDVFLSRDLDDPLDAAGLHMVETRWLHHAGSGVHYHSEPYSTPERQNMVNLGWYGQKNGDRASVPSLAATVLSFVRADPAGTDYYTADEVFLTDVWLPALRRAGAVGRTTRLPSHPFRKPATPHARRSAAFRKFLRRRPPPGLSRLDRQVRLR